MDFGLGIAVFEKFEQWKIGEFLFLTFLFYFLVLFYALLPRTFHYRFYILFGFHLALVLFFFCCSIHFFFCLEAECLGGLVCNNKIYCRIKIKQQKEVSFFFIWIVYYYYGCRYTCSTLTYLHFSYGFHLTFDI